MIKEYKELIPIINGENTWIIDEKNIVVITKEKTGILGKINSKKGKNKREFELDTYGSFVWMKINGKKTIHEIIEEIIEESGEERDTACKRATIFFQMLRVHRLINFIR